MATYLELREQAEKLLAEAEKMRDKEIADTISDIKEKIRAYGLSAEDLGLARGAPRGVRPKATSSAAKYHGPNGETWSGGRGRKPQWVAEALKQGRKIEEFEIRAGR